MATAWRVRLTSRRLLAACWSAPAPRARSRAWLMIRPPPRTKSGSGSAHECARVPFRSWRQRC
eukprot:5622992-Alexandrium_andersonii.AAC.1